MSMRSVYAYYARLLRSNTRWIRIALFDFGFGIILGLAAKLFSLGSLLELVEGMLAELVKLSEQAVDLAVWERVMLIWQNNIVALGIVIFLGFFGGYFSVLALFGNGLLLGYFLAIALSDFASLADLIISVLPHGIIEIPVIVAAAGFGIKLGWSWLLPQARGRRKQVLNATVLECAAFYGLGVILLLFASIIEGWLVFGMVG
ncbi:MAG TPA: stage II sporulation protein M [bacterium]|nr:stage II sporulation protein M [bacterium]